MCLPRRPGPADSGRYKTRLDGVTSALSALEVEDLVTLRDVVTVLQRAEMVRRIAEEIEGYVVELGLDGRLVELQLEELTGGVEEDLRLVCKDYFVESVDWVLAQLTGDSPTSRTTNCSTSASSPHSFTCRRRPISILRCSRVATASLEDSATAGAHRRARRRALRPVAQDHARASRTSPRSKEWGSARTSDQGWVVARCGDFDPRSVCVSRWLCEGRTSLRSPARLRRPHPPPRFAPGRTLFAPSSRSRRLIARGCFERGRARSHR